MTQKDKKMDIFVGNLPYDVDETAIEEVFSAHGTVSNVKLLTDRDSGSSRGIAFVTMDDLKEAQATIKAMDGEEIGGRAIKVNQAREREQGGRPGGGFRRNGGGGRNRY
jgi:RNA recognition motif-containing protein